MIFSNNHTSSWGSFFYNESEDALRVKVKPKRADSREWLVYDFETREMDNTIGVLYWEKVKIPFKISVENETTLNHIKNSYGQVPHLQVRVFILQPISVFSKTSIKRKL